MSMLLSQIESPQDIKAFTIPQLSQLAKELREMIISTVSCTGGHLAPSLGVVELTLVLHYLYDTPTDQIVWDVGHQAYAHKILTGRKHQFHTLRQDHGISGFPKRSESPHDAFGVGHASTSISAALGMAHARDLGNENHHVLAVIGDGALTGGLAFEGLNNAGASGKNMVVILNDNTMSISPNVGAMATYLTTLISNPIYNKIKSELWHLTGKMDRVGQRIRWAARRAEESMKNIIMPGMLFERLGFRYFGPIDGHHIAGMIRLFQEVKKLNGPIFVHVLTKKGKGYRPAEENAPFFHGCGSFDKESGEIKPSTQKSYNKVFGETLHQLAAEDKRIVTITAAMALGTGLDKFAETYPDRFFDVGIAEGHSVTFAAGMATKNLRPVVTIYSSFLQRAYDNIIHDVALQNLPVVFAIDRAGLVGDDGPTHHGVFDLAFLRGIPNMTIMVPKDENELRHMVYTAIRYDKGPIALRYPRGKGEGVEWEPSLQELDLGKSIVEKKGHDIALLALGPLVYRALQVAEILSEEYGVSVQVVNVRFLKPLDTEMLDSVFDSFRCVVTMEEGALAGGLGSAVAEQMALSGHSGIELIPCGIPDEFVEQGNRQRLLDLVGLSTSALVKRISQSKILSGHKKFKESIGVS
ncbi:1-deoxy-D-xylulose-5-phosphate synthase [candidate division KSB1 bacterium]|nr:1-deoxy-D-xylulose-5-phosphate synthase [candidate division KSB1 bacterium]